jgi:UDP-N-acetylglucosamine 2-epimerase (non-hydrolysing)
MIDNLLFQVGKLGQCDQAAYTAYPLKQSVGSYLYLTLHRPANVDDPVIFSRIIEAVNELAQEKTIFFPVHPRTAARIEEFDIRLDKNVRVLPPLGFTESLLFWKDAEAVLTDSGGLQEETTALGVPCVTIRDNTERPITVEIGTNVLAGTERETILAAYSESLAKRGQSRVPELWDGCASERIWDVLTRNASL